MNRRIALPLFVILLVATNASAGGAFNEPWRPFLPEGWLAIAVIRDVDAVEEQFARVLDDLSFEYNGAIAQLKQVAGVPDLEFAEGDLIVGFARSAKTNALFPFALAPTESFEAFAQAIGAEQTGEIAVVTLQGFDLCLAPCGRWVLVCSLNQLEEVQQAAKRRGAADDAAVIGEADLVIEVSSSGLDYLEQRAASIKPRKRRKALRQGLVWPPSPPFLDAAISQNEPLLARWQELFRGVRLEIDLKSDGGVNGSILAPLQETAETQPTDEFATDGFASDAAMVTCNGSGQGAVADLLAQLYLAYSAGRPDEVDAYAYPAGTFAKYEQAVRAAVEHVAQFQGVSEDLGDEGPLYSNQSVLLQVDDADAFQATMETAFGQWNELMRESEAEIQCVFDTRPARLANRDAVEFDIDMVEALRVDQSPEGRQLMEQFYGPGGRYAWRVVPIRESMVLLTDLPRSRAAALAELQTHPKPSTDVAKANGWRSAVHVDRYLTWRRRVDRITTGQPPRDEPAVAMASAPPIELSAAIRQSVLRVDGGASPELIRAIGEYVRDSRAAADSRSR